MKHRPIDEHRAAQTESGEATTRNQHQGPA